MNTYRACTNSVALGGRYWQLLSMVDTSCLHNTSPYVIRLISDVFRYTRLDNGTQRLAVISLTLWGFSALYGSPVCP
jgi:hypothetical protein